MAGQKRAGKDVCSAGEESSEEEDQIWNEMDTIQEKKSIYFVSLPVRL